MSERRLSDFLDRLYRTALKPDSWHELSVPLAQLFDAESCLVQKLRTGTQHASMIGATENFTLEQLANYGEYYFTLDPWRRLAVDAGSGNPVAGRDTIPDSELVRSEVYSDWLKPLGVFQFLGCVDIRGSGLVGLGVHRDRRQPDFGPDEKRLMGLVISHYANAIEITERLDTARHGEYRALAVLDTLDRGVAIVDGSGRLLHANVRAEECFQVGTSLKIANGHLKATDPVLDDALARAIHVAAAVGAGRTTDMAVHNVVAPTGVRGLVTISVSPLPPDSLSSQPALPPSAIVFIDQIRRRKSTSSQLLSDLYGLSSAEARLTAALVDGLDLRGYAEAAQISYQTARTQLRSIFEKTGHARQSDLIRDVLLNPAMR